MIPVLHGDGILEAAGPGGRYREGLITPAILSGVCVQRGACMSSGWRVCSWTAVPSSCVGQSAKAMQMVLLPHDGRSALLT
jgi:hypothetical protein